MAVQTLDLQHDGADVFGTWRRLESDRGLNGLHVRHAVHAPANAADPLRQHRNVVVAKHGLGHLLNPAMRHEPAVLAPAHHLALDIQAKMRWLIQRRMERAKRDNRAAFRRFVKCEFPFVIEFLGNVIPGEILAERMLALRPAIGQYKSLQVAVSHRFDPDQIPHLTFRPVCGWHHIRDAVNLRIVRRQIGEHAAQQVVLVECEIVRHHEIAGKRTVVDANADHVAGVEIAENILADVFHHRRLDEYKQSAVARQIHALDGGSKLPSQLFEPVAGDHVSFPSTPSVCPAAGAAFLPTTGSSV